MLRSWWLPAALPRWVVTPEVSRCCPCPTLLPTPNPHPPCLCADVPLGFGVTAKSTSECRSADPNAIVVFHQADCGEYLRAEDEL